MSLDEEIALVTRSVEGLLAEPHSDDARGELWRELLALDLPHPFHAGADDWRVGAAIVRESGRHATGLPLAENVVGSWLLAEAGLEWQKPRLTLADPARGRLQLTGDRARGTLEQVPHASVSSHLLAACDTVSGEACVALVELRGAQASFGRNAAREPRERVELHDSPAEPCLFGPAATALHWLGALMRAGQMLGLAEWVLTSCLEHVTTRQQFGRPLSAFQAVRHLLTELAGEVAAAQMAVSVADEILARGGIEALTDAEPAIAAARTQSTELCELAIRVGHQLHGAMGFTNEHGLSARTLRLMVYRSEFGYATEHARWLGRRAMSLGADALWPDVVDDKLRSME